MIQAKRSMNEQPDIHARLMSRYPQVPEWWYGVVFGMCHFSVWLLFDVWSWYLAGGATWPVTMFAFGAVSIELWETDFPVWALIVALVRAISWSSKKSGANFASAGCFIPIHNPDRHDPSYHQSTNRFKVSNNHLGAPTSPSIALKSSIIFLLTSWSSVISELVVGYMLPGRPVAMMLFKTWGYITMAQALTFTSDFKLGHYMKIPWVNSLHSPSLGSLSVRLTGHLISFLFPLVW